MNIMMSINDNYVNHAFVLINSIIVNSSKKDIVFYFLNKNLSEGCQRRICLYIKKKGCECVFVDVKDAYFENAPKRENISVETYFRLLAFVLLPDIDKIMYLDADMVVTDDLHDLYNLNMENSCVAGVRDLGDVQNDWYHRAKIGIKSDCIYINGGMLLMNLKKMRQSVKLDNIFDLIVKKGANLIYQDQDIINIIFKDEILVLDDKYNRAPLFSDLCDYISYYFGRDKCKKQTPVIIHYMGKMLKPWNKGLYFYKYLKVYLKYCMKTPCGKLKYVILLKMLMRPVAIIKGYYEHKYYY